MKFTLSESERDTLKQTLDFACSKLRTRLNNGHVMDEWDVLALRIADEKVRKLRDKLFPLQEHAK